MYSQRHFSAPCARLNLLFRALRALERSRRKLATYIIFAAELKGRIRVEQKAVH
jgi:hypothetical protein